MALAFLLLPMALQAQAAQAAPPSPAEITGGSRFERCVALIQTAPDHAYEEGMAWAAETHALGGYRCAAMALVGENRADEGARRLESLAVSVNPSEPELRAELLSQAGNAWLIAHEPAQARSAFTSAIATVQSDPQNLPDLLIDRATAYALERDYRHAEEDLSHSLDIRANDALALRLRATARMHQSAFDLAEADAVQATQIEPGNVDNYLVLGHVRESKRTGTPVDEQ